MAVVKAQRKPRVEISVQDARGDLRGYLNRAEFEGERIVITRYGQPSAALVSIADLEKLEGAA